MAYRVEIARKGQPYREWALLAFQRMAEECARSRLWDVGCMGDGAPADYARVIDEQTGSVVWAGARSNERGTQ